MHARRCSGRAIQEEKGATRRSTALRSRDPCPGIMFAFAWLATLGMLESSMVSDAGSTVPPSSGCWRQLDGIFPHPWSLQARPYTLYSLCTSGFTAGTEPPSPPLLRLPVSAGIFLAVCDAAIKAAVHPDRTSPTELVRQASNPAFTLHRLDVDKHEYVRISRCFQLPTNSQYVT